MRPLCTRSRRRSRLGLTLVEIMVVIAILGTLMTVLAVGLVGYLDEANVDATKLQITSVTRGATSVPVMVWLSSSLAELPSSSTPVTVTTLVAVAPALSTKSPAGL